jgi:hypothetical protein
VQIRLREEIQANRLVSVWAPGWQLVPLIFSPFIIMPLFYKMPDIPFDDFQAWVTNSDWTIGVIFVF